jgi:ribosomal protein L22
MADDPKKDKKDNPDKKSSKKTAKEPKKAAAKKAPEKKAESKKATAKKPAAKKDAKSKDKAKGKEKAKGKAEGEKKAPAKKGAKAPAKKAEKKPYVPIVVRASSKYVRVAPRKARLIADQVRGLHIDKARALLQFSPRGAAHDIGKLIESAASNAENNHDLDADEMRVAEITVDEGPTLKRFRPRALGRATPIHKRTSHIAVALSPEEE